MVAVGRSEGADLIVVLAGLALLGPWPPFLISLFCGILAVALLLVLRFAGPLQA
jgi:hypothetical protein